MPINGQWAKELIKWQRQVGLLPVTSAMTSLGLVGISRVAWPVNTLLKLPTFGCQDAKARERQVNHESIFREMWRLYYHTIIAKIGIKESFGIPINIRLKMDFDYIFDKHT